MLRPRLSQLQKGAFRLLLYLNLAPFLLGQATDILAGSSVVDDGDYLVCALEGLLGEDYRLRTSQPSGVDCLSDARTSLFRLHERSSLEHPLWSGFASLW